MLRKTILVILFVLSTLSYGFAQSLQTDYKNAREPGDEIFVITKDGIKHVGNSIKVVYNVPLLPRDVVKLDGKKINMSDVVSCQNMAGFNKLVDEQRKIFATRIRRGRLNVYIDTWGFNQILDRANFYIEKESASVTNCTYSNLEIMVNDSPKALDKLKEYFPEKSFPDFKLNKKEYNKIIEIFDLYNL